MAWIRVTTLGELRPGRAARICVADRVIALFNVAGTIYAVDDDCPHDEGGSLSRGTVEDASVWCPLHDARFALRTGETLEPPSDETMGPPVNRGVRTYAVTVTDQAVYLDL